MTLPSCFLCTKLNASCKYPEGRRKRTTPSQKQQCQHSVQQDIKSNFGAEYSPGRAQHPWVLMYTDSLFNLLASQTQLDNPESRTQDARSDRANHDEDISDSSMSDQVDASHSAARLETVQDAIPSQTSPERISIDIDVEFEDPFQNHISPGFTMDPPTNPWHAPRYQITDVNEPSLANSEYFGLMNDLPGLNLAAPPFETSETDQLRNAGSLQGGFPSCTSSFRQPELGEAVSELEIPWSLVEEL